MQPSSVRSRYLPWLVWILAASFYFYKFLLEVSPSVMSNELMREFSINAAELGNLAACYFYSYLLMQIPMGILLDHYGPRRVTTVCILLAAIGTLILSYSTSLFMAGTGRFVTGIGAAVAAISCFKITTLWFPPKRFALMAGLILSAGMLGAVHGQAPLAMAVEAFGWRNALLYTAYVGFGIAILFWLFVRDSGYYANFHKDAYPTSIWSGIKELLKKKQTWLLSWYSGLAFAPVTVFGGLWGVPYLMAAHGFTRTIAAEAISLIFIGFAFGAPLLGWWSDQLGRRLPIMGWGTSIALVTVLIVLYWPELSVLTVSFLLFIFGFSISAFLLCFAMIREINRLAIAATALGFMNAFDAALGAITDPTIGFFLDLGWTGQMYEGARIFSLPTYHLAMSLIPLYLAISLLILPFIRETYCRPVDM